MSTTVKFVEAITSPATKVAASWGGFPMTAVPEVGETVILDGTDYRVESRRWKPTKLFSMVTITVIKQ